MAQARKAKPFQHGGSQAVRRPADYRFDGDEVDISRDDATGDVTLSSQPRRNAFREFLAFRDSLDIPQEDRDSYMADRPMNQLVTRRSVFNEDD